MKVIYTAEATAVGGREGRVRSSDGALDLELALPKELGGPGGMATNPEQLFAAGYAACFENAVRHVARSRKLDIGETSVIAKVGIGARGAWGFGFSIELHLRTAGLAEEEARALADQAHQVCPYSNATQGNINVQTFVDVPPKVM